jgi:hypothetical protein
MKTTGHEISPKCQDFNARDTLKTKILLTPKTPCKNINKKIIDT